MRDTGRGARRAGRASTVTPVTAQVIRISDCARQHRLRLHRAADGHIDADIAVLAVGSPAPGTPCPVPNGNLLIADTVSGSGDCAAPTTRDVPCWAPHDREDVAIEVTDSTTYVFMRCPARTTPGARQLRRDGPATWAACAGLQVARYGRRADVAGPHRDEGSPAGLGRDHGRLRPRMPRLWQRLSVADGRSSPARHALLGGAQARMRRPARVSALLGTGWLWCTRGRSRGHPGAGRAAGAHRARGRGRNRARGRMADQRHRPGSDIYTHRRQRQVTATSTRAGPAGLTRLGLDATPSGAMLDAAGRQSGNLITLGAPLRGLWYETRPSRRSGPTQPPWPGQRAVAVAVGGPGRPDRRQR